jgi:(2R)-3-sulfolactate dehydrogenase (NADP+)
MAVDPDALAGGDSYFSRLEVLISRMLADEGVRLPGTRRHAAAAQARADGIEIGDELLAELRQLGGRSR